MKKTNYPEYLKIAALPSHIAIPPYAFVTEKNETIYLLDAQVLSIISRVLKFKTNIILPKDGEYGKILPDNNWTGLVGLLHRGEADLGVSLSVTYPRSLAIDFSYPYMCTLVSFITDKPQSSANPYAILQPFTLNAWLAIIFSMAFLLCISFAFKNGSNSSNIFQTMSRGLLENIVLVPSCKLSTKLLILTWIVGNFFITQSYKAILLSSLTVPIQSGIESIQDLSLASESSSFKCSTYEGGSMYSDILASSHKNWMKIGECLTRTKTFTNDIQPFILSSTYKKAFIGLKNHLDTFQDGYFISEDSFFTNLMSIGIQKSFCCKKRLDRAINKITAMGLFYKFEKDESFFQQLFFRRALKAKINLVDQKDWRKLSSRDFYGAFLCLLSGYTLSSVVLLLELSFCRRNSRRMQDLGRFKTKPSYFLGKRYNSYKNK